ncbi:MAG TPA: cytochrome C oxidase subunit IV family protein [Dehalococcoidia bacterium]|nr:cytochrome C oxidase subunit IV family protein [Dehalococcoidia bacterium]
MKAFFEDPSRLVGIPFLVVGLIGAAIVLMAAFAPERPAPQAAAGRYALPPGHARHPGVGEYVNIGLLLALITAVEVAVYYIDIAGLIVPVLLVLSAAKFLLVVLFFMHLRFDNRLFSTFFSGGFVLAVAVFIVVLATLGASLR